MISTNRFFCFDNLKNESPELKTIPLRPKINALPGWIPTNFKTFIFSPKYAIFWGKITKMITRVNSRILTNSPYVWFLNGSGIRKNPEIQPSCHTSSYLKNGKFRWKIKFFEIKPAIPENYWVFQLENSWEFFYLK